MPHKISVRPAVENDIQILCEFDEIAQTNDERRDFISIETRAGNSFVAVRADEVLGYGVLNYTFFHLGNIDLLYIRAGNRRSGAGTALMRHMESACRTPKLFTSTNLSNLPMRSLLAKLGYTESGIIHNLDEGDPEIVYFKRLR